jgi:hypothetical protein
MATIAIVWTLAVTWGLRAIALQADIPIKPIARAGETVPMAMAKADGSILISV